MAELGRRVGLSAPAVAERVQRLERAGAITGYHAELDPAALGFPVAAVVRIRPSPGQLQRIPEIARETPEVGECHRITGEDCYCCASTCARSTISRRSSTASRLTD